MKLSEAILALERGEEVEYADYSRTNTHWFSFTKEFSSIPVCRAFDLQFRLKPKPPKEIWVNVYENDFVAHVTKDQAEREAKGGVIRTAVKFREVVGE